MKNPKRIVVLEDDPFDREHIAEHILKKRFSQFGVVLLNTEAEFHSAFSSLIAEPPTLVLLDMRVRWTDPAPNMPIPPAEVLTGTYREAGVRCWRILRQNPTTIRVPVIFYTCIDETENAGGEVISDPLVKFVEKDVVDTQIVASMRHFLRAT